MRAKKPAAAKKKPAAAKKKPAAVKKKPAAVKKKPASGGAAARVAASLAALRQWAAAGTGTLEWRAKAADQDTRLRAPKPEWGTIQWALPPSYRAFLEHASRLAISWGDNVGHDEFILLSPNELRETGGIVYMPKDVSRDEGVYLTTNHLVPFASGGNDECAFCFDVTQARADGEYPVYFHHQDEPRARRQVDGAWEDPASAKPDFADFAAWLEWVAAELSAGREPACSYPYAFNKMPGRAGGARVRR
jgi:hypothetical protein